MQRTKEQILIELLNVWKSQAIDLSMMSKIEFGDDVIQKITELNTELDCEDDNRININIIKWEDTTEFTFPIHEGIVIKVYDGDTFTIATKIPDLQNSPLYRFPVRLAGIDTPEIKTNNMDQLEDKLKD